MGTPSSFLIETQTGPKRTLELRGRALPYRGLAFEGTTRAEVTWFPGNAVGSLQVMGTEESPTTANGQWKDRFIMSSTDEGVSVQPDGIALFNGQQVASAKALVDAVELIRSSGQLIKLTWDAFTRTGIIKRFKANLQRIEDIEWEMEFLWNSRGQVVTPVTLPTSVVVESFAQKVQNLAAALKGRLKPPAAFNLVAGFSKQLEALMSSIDDAALDIQNTATASIATLLSPVDVLENAIALAERAILSPLEAIQRSIAAAVQVQNKAQEIVDFVESVPSAAVVQLTSTEMTAFNAGYLPSPTAAVPFATALGADQWRRGVKNAARALAVETAQDAEVLRQQQRSDLLAVFTARGSMDLRQVAQQFYGTVDEWRRIMQFNNFGSSELAAGQMVLVPKLSTDEINA